jgi:ribosomal protein S18 acetylase RimI-like enzyme
MIRPRTSAYIEELAVAGGHRRVGIGRRLVGAVEEWGSSRGCELVMLDTGTRNVGARRFYDRIGFREIGVVLVKERGPED